MVTPAGIQNLFKALLDARVRGHDNEWVDPIEFRSGRAFNLPSTDILSGSDVLEACSQKRVSDLAETYLEKAQQAEEAGLKSTNPEMREGWLEVARSYRLLASRVKPSPSHGGGDRKAPR